MKDEGVSEETNSGSEQGPSEQAPLVKGGWLRALLLFLSFLIVQGIVGLIAAGVIKMISGLPIRSVSTALQGGAYPRLLLIHQVLALGGTLLLVLFFRKKVDRKDLPSLGLRLRISPFLAGLLLGPLMMGGCMLLLYAWGGIGIRWDGLRPELLSVYLLLTFAIALKEELLFRGYLLNNLMASMRAHWALLVSAIAFLGLHGLNPNINPVGILNLFLAGLLLGVSYIHDRQLAFPVGLHLSWNFAQGPLFGFNVSGLALNKGSPIESWTQGADIQELPSYLSGGNFGLEGSLLLSGLQLILIPLIYWIWKKKQ